MGNIYVFNKDYYGNSYSTGPESTVYKPGHRLVVSRTIDVVRAWPGVIESDLGDRYWLGEWNIEFGTPAAWPPRAGDIWNSFGMDYVAMQRPEGIVLEPTEGPAPRVYPEQYDRFLESHPYLVRRR